MNSFWNVALRSRCAVKTQERLVDSQNLIFQYFIYWRLLLVITA